MKCPQCYQQIQEGAKFCSDCGAQVVEDTTDIAWVAGIQEEIKKCRSKITRLLSLMGGGIYLFALIHVILSHNQPGSAVFEYYYIWSLPVGLAVVIGGIVGSLYYENMKKKLIRRLTEPK